jgi:release factor H-coupled RctB family protein
MTTQNPQQTNVRLIASTKNWVTAEALRRVFVAAKLPGVRRGVALPNLHAGSTAPVGAAFVTEGVIYPHLIGGDIGCGVALFKTDLRRRKATPECWAELRFDLEHPWEGHVRNRLSSEALSASHAAEMFGTLGGGAHFAELEAIEKVFDQTTFDALRLDRTELVLLVHSGSGAVGQAVLENFIEEQSARGAEVDSDAATGYVVGHDHAVRWAEASRSLIAERFLNSIGASGERLLDACHNSIARYDSAGESRALETSFEFERARETGRPFYVHRRSAVASDCGPFVIPGTCGSLSYLVQPTSDGESHVWSLAGGAGRKWPRGESRTRMRERFRPEQLTQTGLGGRVVCDDRSLLYEEAPPAYKDIDVVVADLANAGLISIIATLRAVFTYRARTRNGSIQHEKEKLFASSF